MEEQDSQSGIQTRVKRIGFAAFILSMGILCSRILGFLRESVIAYQAGSGSATDAYNAAFMLPDIMNHFLAGGTLSITFIPLFADYISKKQPEKAERLFSLIATTMGSFLVAAILLCEFFATPLATLIFPGFDAAQISDTVRMTRVILPGQLFHYLGALMMAVLMARGIFLPSAIAPLIYNLMIILCGLILGPSMGMMGFALGALIGALLGPCLVPLLFLRKKIKYRPLFGFRDADFKKYIWLTLPLMVGVSLNSVDEWLCRSIGSDLGAGAISWLNYARRLVLMPIVLVGQAAGQAALPYLSQLSAQKEFGKIADTLQKTLKNVIILSLVLAAFFVVLPEPMVALVYEHGAFTADDTQITAGILRILAISIVFWTIQMVSVRAFYAAQNTLTPMVLTTIVTLLSIGIYYGLSRFYGINGMAVASCIGMLLQALVIVVYYPRLNPEFKPLRLFKYIGIGLLLAAFTAGGSYGGLRLAGLIHLDSKIWTTLLELALGGICGVIATFIPARFIIPEELHAFTGKILRKIKRK